MNNLGNKTKFVGNNDPVVSPHLKIWIKQGVVIVCGVLGEGTSKEIQSNWDSPFEGESVGSKFQKTGGAIQSGALSDGLGINYGKGRTTITTVNSRQVWGGNRPTQFNIIMQFYALHDPQTEVMNALIELEKMASPQVNEFKPGGRIPGTVSINIGRNAIYPDCVIESISIPLDKEVNKDGLLIRAEVTLAIQTKQMDSKSDIKSRY